MFFMACTIWRSSSSRRARSRSAWVALTLPAPASR
jgi:hypothetical protein